MKTFQDEVVISKDCSMGEIGRIMPVDWPWRIGTGFLLLLMLVELSRLSPIYLNKAADAVDLASRRAATPCRGNAVVARRSELPTQSECARQQIAEEIQEPGARTAQPADRSSRLSISRPSRAGSS